MIPLRAQFSLKWEKVFPVSFHQRWNKLLWEAKQFNFTASIQIEITKFLSGIPPQQTHRRKTIKRLYRLRVWGCSGTGVDSPGVCED